MLIVACLTLGLAPFAPEPHVVGKLRWVLGGAQGMGPMNYRCAPGPVYMPYRINPFVTAK